MRWKRDEFIKRWRSKAMEIGLDALSILRGDMKERKAQCLLDLPTQIDGLIGRMWDDLQSVETMTGGQKTPVKV